MKKLFAVFALALLLAACGGGGSGSSAASDSSATQGSGGTTVSGGSSGGSTASSTTGNVVSVTVDNRYNFLNAPYVSVTICAPGTTRCATIDHVILDTGSVGLRLLRSAIPSSLGLTNVKDPVGGNTLAECAEFGAGHAWGPISTVDLKMAGETASNLQMQIVDDTYASMPSDCASYGPDMSANGATSFGGNGILGVQVLRRDCLTSCTTPTSTLYYDCAGATCTAEAMPDVDQLLNPISAFSSDNNGMTLTFPSVPAGGTASVTGTMTFGINTQSDNMQSGSVTKIDTTAEATVNASYNGQSLLGVLDSGSGAYFIPDSTISQCPTSFSSAPWFCPAQQVNRTATLQSQLGGYFDVAFSIVNAQTELSNSYVAHTGVGENVNLFGAGLLDLGLPFFYGKSITFGVQGNDDFTSGDWPYYAIQS
jgi:hypothetical protein